MFAGQEFADRWVLWLLLLVPLLVVWYIWRERDKKNAVRFSSFALLRTVPTSKNNRLRHTLFGVRVAGLTLLIVALARPQSFYNETKSTTEEWVRAGPCPSNGRHRSCRPRWGPRRRRRRSWPAGPP